MKRIAAITVWMLLLTTTIFSQNLTQTVRGTILDEDSKMPLIGAQVIVLGSDPLLGTASDEQGNFRLDKVPIGRISLQVSYLGYKNAIIPNVVVNSGKETLLNLTMQESAIKMEEVVITEDKNKGEALNDMAMISARSISPEQTNRYAGGFNDP
nr:carboxypeptidase-like regulatory domain-containing protein [Haliscomenobacter sp.]